ncbi:rod shape-determining protein [Viridibacillus sp. YIM B01967]|uniref:Rod shape-determining protein n=1 Tax=Viridibacillus soli TaxID=2798301 RepID=A0ABS1H9R5_9BACL|nr:cell division FtsA domain-containing protein [Viridibacillus soli]MBK3496049.1 rod shape-determining protein [Viridibacillus soli]
MPSKLFALDIGTRSVVGIILEEQGEKFHVVDLMIEEHKERAMVDGQIHNVLHVASLIEKIKTQLEEKHGPLHKVSVAAAGRALKTEQASVTINIKNRPAFSEDDISRLELAAVQQAQQQLLQHKEKNNMSHYYCVGYSVLYYRLDHEEIGSLIDQQGEEASVEVIATFLPRVVVESLLAALKRAGLEMEALTLEPIAAINALIPPTMRRLNIALVDIGAGTSDIAITDKSTVVAYGMVPTAGDEITEALSDHYLLDFPIAEKAKREMATQDEINIKDILGFDQFFQRSEIMENILPAVVQLATAIGSEVLRLNNNVAPKAVLLVGGGSLTPDLTKELCKVLELPENRVAVRGIDAIQQLTREDHVPASPELVTPIGIAIAAKRAPIKYMTVEVNKQVIRLFELKEMTVSDSLLAANVLATRLYGKPGLALSITVNDQDIHIPGGHGSPTEIFVNGEKTTTKHPIQNGDIIELNEGQNGAPATALVKDILDDAGMKKVYIQDREYEIKPKITINGQTVSMDTELKDRDQIAFETADTIEELLNWTDNKDILKQLIPFTLYIDNKPVHFPEFSNSLMLNSHPTKLHYAMKNDDRLTIQMHALPTVEVIAKRLDMRIEDQMIVTFQDETLEMTKICMEVYINGEIARKTDVLTNGAKVQFVSKDPRNWIYQDVFRFSNWQLPTNFKGSFSILRNDTPSKFDAEIFGGDKLSITLNKVELQMND